MHILVLATGTLSKYLTDAIKDAGHTYDHYKPTDLYLLVSDSVNGYDKVYDGNKDLDKPLRILAKNYDAMITRLGGGLAYGTTVLSHFQENLDIYCPQTEEGLMTASNKMKTTQKLSAKGLRVPKTVFAEKPTHVDFLVEKVGNLPAVAKTIRGSQGVGVMILRDAEQTNTSLEAFYNLNVNLVLQSFIESGAKDIRAIVCGDKVTVAMERQGKKDFRANISQGGSGRKIELSKEDEEICVNASKAIGLEFSGVDILKDVNGKTYVCEVNGNPGEKIIQITGVNYFKDLVKHIENNYKNPDKKISMMQSEFEEFFKAVISNPIEMKALQKEFQVKANTEDDGFTYNFANANPHDKSANRF
jgi:ribosomal protein S6--L-glutamate ligase